MNHPTLEQCRQVRIGSGLPDTPEERARFESYVLAAGVAYDKYVSPDCYEDPEVWMAYRVWRDRGRLAQAESDQLRARIAALEAEVARLKEPVGLAWEQDGAFFSSGDYVACSTAAWCGELTIWQGIDEGVEAAIAVCTAHHLARYREMQGAS